MKKGDDLVVSSGRLDGLAADVRRAGALGLAAAIAAAGGAAEQAAPVREGQKARVGDPSACTATLKVSQAPQRAQGGVERLDRPEG